MLGEEHKDTLSTLANIAYTYAELGDYAKAVEIYEKVYPLRVKVLGKDHEQTLKTLSRLEEARGKLKS